MPNRNRNMHLFLLGMLPVLTRGVTWTLGAAGDTCTSVCSYSSGGCNQNELTTLANYPSAWTKALGTLTCTPTVRNDKHAFGTPYVHQHSLTGGPCYYPTAAGSVAVCSIDPSDNNHRRLCPCGTTTTTPDCSSTNGQTQTTETCKCGTSTCSPTEACLTSNCLTEPLCANVNGATINSGTCQCLTNECTTSTGLYCKITLEKVMPYVPATSICYSDCANINGATINSATCQCGTLTCTSSNGLFCKTGPTINTCFKSCSNTDGQQVNTEYCKCDTKECTSATGLYCKIIAGSSTPFLIPTKSKCFKACDNPNGLIINSGICACGTSTCSTNEYCKSAYNLCYKTCPTGQIKATETCKCGTSTCSSNEYCNGNLCSLCVSCEIGTYGFVEGSTTQCCLACQPGYYSTNNISSTCQACQPGFFAAEKKAETCSPCGIGTYAASNGTATCTVCAPGAYQNENNSTKCKLCPGGKTLVTAATADYHDALSDCEDCGFLQYNPFEGHADTCYPCLTAKTEGSWVCDGCEPGKFKVTIVLPDGNKTDECKDCESGYFSIKQNSHSCSECPLGFFANHQLLDGENKTRYDRCQACPRGTFGIATRANNASEGCSNCTSGTYSDKTGIPNADLCKGCPKGTWSADFGVTKESACVNCGTGKYGINNEGASAESSCTQCTPGQFLGTVGEYGQTSCEACPLGKHQNKPGAAFCLPCTPGRYNKKWGKLDCVKCAVGTASSTVGRLEECVSCLSGKRQPAKGTTACLNCIPGRYQDQPEQKDCKNCAVGQASSTPALTTECDSCIPGRYQSKEANTVCNACPAGWAALQSGVGCTSCTFGQYRVADEQALACTLCPIGFASETNGSAGCLGCAAGKFASVNGSEKCMDCSSGQFRGNENLDSSTCIDCLLGEFSAEMGQPFCLGCDAGTFANQHGSTKCQVCPTGFTQSEKRGTACDQCVAGKFSSEIGQSLCFNCDKGTYSKEGASLCKTCPSGKITAVKGESSCKTCPSGFVTAMGSSCVAPPYLVAESCPPNEYLNDQSSDRLSHTCVLCPVGAACGVRCPKNAGTCPNPNNISLSNIYPLPTYWKIPIEYGPGKELFARCPFPQDCKYDFKNGSTCVSGTTGDLCSRCIVGYDRVSSKCTPCVENEILFRVILLLVLILLVFVGIYKSRRVLKKLHHKYAGAARDTLLAVKIIISFLQINLSMPSMMSSFQFPELYILFLNRMSIVNVDMASVLGVQCVVNVDFRYSLLVATLLPLFVLIFCAAVYVIYSRRIRVEDYSELQRDKAIGKLFDYGDFDGSGVLDEAEFYTIIKTAAKHHKFYKHESNSLLKMMGSNATNINAGPKSVTITIITRDVFIKGVQSENAQKYINIDDLIQWVQRTSLFSQTCSACSLLLMVLHAPVSAKAFYYFDCHQLGAHKSLLRRDYSLECWADRHSSFIPLAVLLLLLFAFLFPVALFGMLVSQRHHLHLPLTRSRIGWLYPRFVVGAEWWDIHELLRKMLLCGVLVFVPGDTRPLVAILISLVACCTLNYFRPHKNTTVFWIAQASFGLTTLKYLIVVFGMLHPLSKEGNDVLSGLLIFLDLLLIFFCVACVVLIFLLLRGTIKQVTSKQQQQQQQQLPLHFPQTASATAPVPGTQWALSQHHITRALADANARKTTEMAALAVAHAKEKIIKNQEKSSERLQKRLQKRLGRRMLGTPTPPLSVSVVPTVPNAAKLHPPSKKHRQVLEKVQRKLSAKIKTFAVLTTIFTKLDVDHSGGINKEEFAALIKAVLKNTPKGAMVDMLWDMAWEGNTPKKMEMDINILGSWFGII